MMRKNTATRIALMALFAAAPLCAQRGDPTNAVTGSGKLPDGWMLRFDPPRGNRPAPPMTAVSFVTMGSGFHVTSGPAAIYYNTKDVGTGVYSVAATFKAAKSMVGESYGIFIGGSNLQDSTQSYLYMVIRPSDGGLAIEHRGSNAAPAKLQPMAVDANVNKDSPTDGSSANTLMIHVAKDTVHFIVNGKMVKAIAKADLGGAKTDGQAGLRINHNIDIHIDSWTGVKK